MKKYKFYDIPLFTKRASYSVTIPWNHLEATIERDIEETGLNLDPDFQRAHVWNETQQKRYVEFVLRGGHSSRELLFNCPGWQTFGKLGKYVLVDGKQRLEAVRKFMRNELSIFDNGMLKNKHPLFLKDFDGHPDIISANFLWSVNDLKTRAEVLQWYLDLNSGGVVHSKDEIEKVKKLLENE